MKHGKQIQRAIDKKKRTGGKVYLPAGSYTVSETLVVDIPSFTLEGESWACNVDPNGVFESPYGTKLRLKGRDFPAILVGDQTVLSGTMVKDIGIQGDIEGMDTRPLLNMNDVSASAGIFIKDKRVDQATFSHISCCGLGVAVCAKGDCFVDACTFEKINTDGCCIGVYFAPKVSVYTHFKQFIVADTPSYGFLFDGTDRWVSDADISDMILVRNGGSSPVLGEEPAAVYLKNVVNCIFKDNLVCSAGTFLYYAPDATDNGDAQIHKNKAIGLLIEGRGTKVWNNTFGDSSAESIVVRGDGNILMNNTVDSDVVISGKNNVVRNLVFTDERARLILLGQAADTTDVAGVAEDRILQKP